MRTSSIMLWVAGTSVAAITCGSQNQAEPRQTSLGTWYLASVMPEHGGYGDYGRWFAYGYPDAVPGFPAFTALGGTFQPDEELMGFSTVATNSLSARSENVFVLNQTITVDNKTKVAMGCVNWDGVSKTFIQIPVVGVYDGVNVLAV